MQRSCGGPDSRSFDPAFHWPDWSPDHLCLLWQKADGQRFVRQTRKTPIPPFQWKTHTDPLKSAEDFDVRVLQSVKCISIEQRLSFWMKRTCTHCPSRTLWSRSSAVLLFIPPCMQSSLVRAAYSLIPPRPSWISAIISTSSREIRLRAMILWRYIVYNHIELVVIWHSKIVCRWQMMGRGGGEDYKHIILLKTNKHGNIF